tara:strand:- start:223 stop:441 length:219 start_codon:yes stop_codon:yes gene_type:complete
LDKNKKNKLIYLKSKTIKFYRKEADMTLKEYLVAGVIEQVIMFGIILPATGWWFSFFALSAIWNLVAGGFSR